MLYIKKSDCPPEVAKVIEEKIHSELWRDVIDPASHGLSEKEKSHSVQTLRAHFDELDKKALRSALLHEQHFLCAYCMAQIEDNGRATIIEHWSPLGEKKENAIDYGNFLAVCCGGRNATKIPGAEKVLCCDASKGEQTITINPQSSEMMDGIGYTSDGLIYYQDDSSFDTEVIQGEIDHILQLNGKMGKRTSERIDTATRLIQQRRNVYKSTEKICLDMLDSGDLNEAWLSQQICSCLDVEKRDAFAGVALFVYNLYRKKLSNSR